MKKIILNLLFFVCIFSFISNISYAKTLNSTNETEENSFILTRMKEMENKFVNINNDYKILKDKYNDLEEKYNYLQRSQSSMEIMFRKYIYEINEEIREAKHPIRMAAKKVGKKFKKFIKKI